MSKKTIGKLLLGAVALFFIGVGTMFGLAPERAATKLLVDPQGVAGLSNLRAFVGAPLLGIGISLLIGAITEKLEHARAAAVFLVALLVTRGLSFAADGAFAQLGVYVAIPAVTFVVMLVGHKLIDLGSERPTRSAA